MSTAQTEFETKLQRLLGHWLERQFSRRGFIGRTPGFQMSDKSGETEVPFLLDGFRLVPIIPVQDVSQKCSISLQPVFPDACSFNF